jgi:hypothetical protein
MPFSRLQTSLERNQADAQDSGETHIFRDPDQFLRDDEAGVMNCHNARRDGNAVGNAEKRR